jgi:hypothetical protein
MKKKQDVQNSLKSIIKAEKSDEEEEENNSYFNDNEEVEQNFSGSSNRKNIVIEEKTTSSNNSVNLRSSSNNILDEKDRSLLLLLNKCQNDRDNSNQTTGSININANGKRLPENETKIFQKHSPNVDDEIDDDVIENLHTLNAEEQSELDSYDSQDCDIDSVGPWLEKKFQEIQDKMDDDRD